MSKARQQSLAKAIKRGNVVVSQDRVTGNLYHTWKKGSTRQQWSNALRNRVSELPEESFNPVINKRRAQMFRMSN